MKTTSSRYNDHHAIVTIESCDEYITLKTLDAQYGSSMRMFIRAGQFSRWLAKPGNCMFMDYDCGSFTLMHRIDKENVHIHLTWAYIGSGRNITGYTQDFDVAVHDLQAVLVAGMRVRKLVDLGSKTQQADITITNGAHRQIRSIDKLHRRALSKAMRDNFHWKRSSVCLYADWGGDFAFVDQRMSGGLCLHETKVTGKDGKPHRKLVYQVHT